MAAPITQEDLCGCVTARDLADLFNVAFGAWLSTGLQPGERRRTPRVSLDAADHIYVVSCSHDGQETKHQGPARIVDLSADGLGIALAEPVPIGASIRFAFASEGTEPDFGVATVARLVKQAEGYLIGVTFAESAQVLDAEAPPAGDETSAGSPRKWRQRFHEVVDSICGPGQPPGRHEPPGGAFPGKHRYVIPRGGKLVCTAVENREQLRTLRTELELLHHTNDRIAARGGSLPLPGKPESSDPDLREFLAILHDAAHPVVPKTIAQIDAMFPDLRAEIAMTVVAEEADRIARETLKALGGEQVTVQP